MLRAHVAWPEIVRRQRGPNMLRRSNNMPSPHMAFAESAETGSPFPTTPRPTSQFRSRTNPNRRGGDKPGLPNGMVHLEMNLQGSWKWAVYVFCVALAGLVVVLGVQKRDLIAEKQKLQEEEFFPKESEWLPELTFTSLDGRELKIGQNGAGRQIVVHFSTKCPACISSAKFLAELSRSAKKLNVEMIGFTPETNRADVQKFLTDHQIDMPVVSVPDRKTLGILQFRMSPTLMVLSPQGQIEYVHVGTITSDMEAVGVLRASVRKESVQAKL